ncbi:hypothetical protein [Pseudoduganella sp. GCM10020061]|uniref:hypothetical protein n=1 Tax=Pseudoduganella sp. GCM10020061 TaxID=3317345 RepID=UPI003633C099
MIESFLGVFALAIIEMWAAIPLGFHLKLHPVLLAVATMTGAFAGAVAAIYLGNGLRRLMFWRSKEKTEEGRVSKWLIAKGPWAIGLLGPGLLGPTIAAGLAGAIGLPRARSLALLGAGIVVWTAGLVAAGAFGVAALR